MNSYEADDKFVTELQGMIDFKYYPMPSHAREQTLQGIHTSLSRLQTKRRVRPLYRWTRSTAAVGAAVVVVSCVAYQVANQHGKNGPIQQNTNPEMTYAAQQWKDMLGFQPLKPTYLPAGVTEKTVSAGIGPGPKAGQKADVYSISYQYQDASKYGTMVVGKQKVPLEPLLLTEEPLADQPSILQDFKSLHYVTVNGTQFMIPVNQQPSKGATETILCWKHNGLLLTVAGTQSRSVLARVLLSLTPTTEAPGEIDKSVFHTAADAAFKVILPTYLPKGFKQDLSENTGSGESLGPGKKILSSYETQYLGPQKQQISIGEYYARDTENPQGIDKHTTPMQIQGQTVHLYKSRVFVGGQAAPYYRFEWIDPKTHVSFWVDGVSTTTRKMMTKSLMEKVVSSMIAQSDK